MTDCDLIARFRGGDKSACDQLLNKYKPVVLRIARRFFLSGGETEDLVQEGMCGLYSAMLNFESGDFVSYAYACIKNRIVDAVKRSASGKNYALNSSVPIGDEALRVASHAVSPEDALISGESLSETDALMRRSLSPLEYRVMSMYVDGASMNEMCAALGKNYKSIDNAITRSKNKLQKILGGGK